MSTRNRVEHAPKRIGVERRAASEQAPVTARELLDLLDHARRRLDVQAVRPRERLDEPVDLPPRALWIVERRSDLPHVRVEVVGEPQQPATFRRQMTEVERAVLGASDTPACESRRPGGRRCRTRSGRWY